MIIVEVGVSMMLKKLVRNTSYILFIICIMLANLYVPTVVEAKTLNDLKRELQQLQSDYENHKLEKEMNEQEKQKIQNNIQAINNEIAAANEEMVTLNEEIERLNEEILKDEEEIQAILAFTQVQNGESAYLEYAFGAKNFTDFIYRLAVSEQLTTYNNELIETNKRNIEENKKRTEELNQKKIELSEKQERLQIEVEKIAVSIDKESNNMLSIEETIESLRENITMYENMGCGLDEDVNACMDRNNSLPPDTQMWRPLEAGYVSGWYGMRWHPIWHEDRMHSGMDISQYGANNGTTPVYAVANGRVVEAINTYSTCGGKKLYIQHNINGVTYTTGYWHLNTLFVKKGDIVTKDTKIGIIAGRPDPTYGNIDGCSNGGHLHLEISTAVWDVTAKVNPYYSHRFDIRTMINFPKSTYNPWTNRTRRF